MRVVSIGTARVGFLKPIDEILPLESAYPPQVAKSVAERYSFQNPPDFAQPWSAFREKGMEFLMGRFEFQGSTRHIENLRVLGDGLIVTAPGTDVGEAFIADLLAWGAETQGFRVHDDINDRLAFLSQLIVEFDASLDRAISAFAALSGACADLFKATYGLEVDLRAYGFSLNYDRTGISGRLSNLSLFGFERRAGEPYNTNRLFCQAPLRTKDHIKLLEIVESTLAGLP
jgi:hypothetical protein